MFNRTRTASGDGSPASATFDNVLAELDAPVAPQQPPTTVPAPAHPPAPVDHAGTLRATRDAQTQAQEMLTMAAQARNHATEQAEQIVVEARDAAEEMRAAAAKDAERTRRETADWVQAQRARVEDAVSEMTQTAEQDAESIRSEAMRSAMAEAEQTARMYVGEAAARGARDAEEIRSKARDVLVRAAGMGADLQTSVLEITEALSAAMATVQGQLAAIDQLLVEARSEELPSVSLPPAPAASTAAAPPVPDPLTDPVVPEAPARVDHLEGRQLGSMFRGDDLTGA